MPSIPDELNKIFPAHWIRITARKCGAVKRFVKVDMVVFFWVLMLGPVGGSFTTLASMQRRFELAAGLSLARSSFLKRFSKPLVTFLQECLDRAMSISCQQWANPSLFAHFNEVLVQDSSVITLSDALARFFPGAKTKAAAKVNAVYSVLKGTIRSLAIASGKRGEVRFVRITRELAGSLLLLDLGYFSWAIFARIDRADAFFISRLKSNTNPRIVEDRHQGPGRKRELAGMKLRQALKGLLRQELDVTVEVTAVEKRRPTKTNPRKTVRRKVLLRVVGVRHPDSGQWHLYVTNIPFEVLAPDQISVAYSARWFGELLFRELKDNCQMDRLPTRRPEVVRALLLSAAIRLMLSRGALEVVRRRLMEKGRRRCPPEFYDFLEQRLTLRTGHERFHAVWRDLAPFFLVEVLEVAGIPRNLRRLEQVLMDAVFDPNVRRDSLWWRIFLA